MGKWIRTIKTRKQDLKFIKIIKGTENTLDDFI